MSLTTLDFFVFFALSLVLFYLTPGRFQWWILLGISIIFFCFSSPPITWIYMAICVFTTTLCNRLLLKTNALGELKKARLILLGGVIVNVGILAILNYTNFVISNINAIIKVFGISHKLAPVVWKTPIGISFYTLQAIGYLLDTHWGINRPNTNFAKTALFIGYYPQLTSGPIARYGQLQGQLYSPHKFDKQTIGGGLLRILWGLFKKLVIASRCGVIVDTIYGDTNIYQGFYIWFAAALFMMQLYADFSGCMDIIIGASECYGITLPENFRTPFFSRSVQEYWQRWHITLGAWLKDYILYPILRSGTWRKLTKLIKKHLGKKAAKQIPAYLGMLCVWLLIGLWHGGKWKYIIGMGIWFWMLITLSQVFDPFNKKIIQFLHIRTDCFSWHLFQSLRVFVLVCIGNMFFRLDGFLKTIKTICYGVAVWNPEIFFDDSIYNLGLDEKNVRLMFLSLGVLLLISVLQEKESIRSRLARQNLIFRWSIIYILIFSVILFGMYGPGFDAQSFIYEQF